MLQGAQQAGTFPSRQVENRTERHLHQAGRLSRSRCDDHRQRIVVEPCHAGASTGQRGQGQPGEAQVLWSAPQRCEARTEPHAGAPSPQDAQADVLRRGGGKRDQSELLIRQRPPGERNLRLPQRGPIPARGTSPAALTSATATA